MVPVPGGMDEDDARLLTLLMLVCTLKLAKALLPECPV